MNDILLAYLLVSIRQYPKAKVNYKLEVNGKYNGLVFNSILTKLVNYSTFWVTPRRTRHAEAT
jgi:hypothetical protein